MPGKRKSKPENEQSAVKGPSAGGEHEKANRMSSFYLRTVTTIAMIFGFVVILCLGHSYAALFIIALLFLGFKELKALKRQKEQENRIPLFNTINWYFFFVFVLFILPMYLPNTTRFGVKDPYLLEAFEYHKLIGF